MEVLVEYDYQAQNPDELTIKKGERIRNVVRKEEGWFEGELSTNGRRGVFPDNFVKQIKSPIAANVEDKKKNFLNNTIGKIQKPVKATSPPPTQSNQKIQNNNNNNNNNTLPLPVKQNTEHFNARVVFSYIPVNDDELSIQENDIVQVLRLVEDGWYEGIHNGRRGVFPSNYVEKINDSILLTKKSTNISNESINSNSPIIENHNNSILNQQHITDSTNDLDSKKNKKKVLGIGFGNIFSGKQIELKTKENFNANNMSPTSLSSSKAQDINVNLSPVLKRISKAKVVYDYEPTQPDELKLVTGEFIYILDKHLEDEGWWKGESILTGKIGVFPDNFVKEIDEPIVPTQLNGTNSKRKSNIQIPIKTNTVQTEASNLNSLGSSSSASSSSNSLQRETKQNSAKIQSQPQHIDNENNFSKSQSDMSEDLDEIQKTDLSKLTHIKKTRQFNKRPPSFRNKPKLNHEDMIVQDVSSTPQPPQLKSPELSKSPTQLTIDSGLKDELNNVRQELELFKKSSAELINDYKEIKKELDDVKKQSDDQIKKMQKNIYDLISEIDEEKKTRLALQVELERLKKIIKMNN